MREQVDKRLTDDRLKEIACECERVVNAARPSTLMWREMLALVREVQDARRVGRGAPAVSLEHDLV